MTPTDFIAAKASSEWGDPDGFAAAVAELPAEVRARVPIAAKRASEKIAEVRPNPVAQAMLDAARGARSNRQRVIWLQRWGSAWAEPLARVSAWRRGCSHCCHLPVAITSAEARLIGDATGRSPAVPADVLPIRETVQDPDLAQRWRDAEKRVIGTACRRGKQTWN